MVLPVPDEIADFYVHAVGHVDFVVEQLLDRLWRSYFRGVLGLLGTADHPLVDALDLVVGQQPIVIAILQMLNEFGHIPGGVVGVIVGLVVVNLVAVVSPFIVLDFN